ncbi:MAG: FAD/NAD(P)-binding oxidoreductase [Pseudoclavibacter sp.]
MASDDTEATMSTTLTPYLIIGDGQTGHSAAAGIREVDPDAEVTVLGSDDAAYQRPPLSKALWRDPDTTEASIGLELPAEVVHRPHTPATRIDPVNHTVILQNGEVLQYGKLILATGGTPRTLGEPGPRIRPYRTRDDYHWLRELADAGRRVLVVGGGFIGLELAAALRIADAPAALVISAELVGGGSFPTPVAEHLDAVYRDRGVELHAGTRVEHLTESDAGVEAALADGTTVTADAAVLGLGITPDTGLAEAAGLAVDDGIVVDDHLATSAADIFAAGDVASYPDARLGRRRVEHEDAANTQGRCAGRNAAGAGEVYDHTPFFYSDLFDDGYEAVGELGGGLTQSAAARGNGEWIGFSRDDEGRVRGLLFWNVWGDDEHDTKAIAADILAEHTTAPDAELLRRF